jgi:hypothetical protein
MVLRRFRGTRRKVAAFVRTAAGALSASAPDALASMALVSAAVVLALGPDPGPRAAGSLPRMERGAADCPVPRSNAGAEALAEWYALLWTELE